MAEKYRLVEGRLAHADGVYEEGDTFEAADSTVRVLGDRVEKVGGDDEDRPEARQSRSADFTGAAQGGGEDAESTPSTDDDHDEPAEEVEEPVEAAAGDDGNAAEDDDTSAGAGDGEEPAANEEGPVEEAAGDDGEDGLDYDSMSVSEVEQALEEHDFSDEELDDLIDYERQNKDRKGAKEAIKAQR